MPNRRTSALLIAALVALQLGGCTSGGVSSGSGTTRPAAPGRIPAKPRGSSVASPGESVLSCGSFIDGNATTAPLQVVLGVVALPVSPADPALQTSLSGDGGGPLRLFAKTGLVVRPGATFDLIVPAQVTGRLRIGWGTPGTPSPEVAVNSCPNTGDGWLAYAGGYWIDHPACVRIIVRAGNRQQVVHIGVGVACPGQQPPQGPSQR